MPETLHRLLNPKSAPPAFSPYSQGVEAAEGRRWLHVSGQVGVSPDGALAEGAESQIRQAWANVLAILVDAGMDARHLVKVTVFLTRAEDVGLYRVLRDEILAGAKPASTLILVAGLAHPAWLVEIEAVAAA